MNGWRTAVRLGAGLFACGCAHAARGTPAGAAATAPTSATSSTCASTMGVGTLRFLLTLQPTVPETTEALVRLESETERSTVRVNATLGTTFQLRPGTYRLSITLPGYASAERSVTIACGSDTTLTVPLAKKR
jgi:hypothetical protein